MIMNALYTQNDILGMAMQAAFVRNDVISNNVANADTPGFKRKAVVFEQYLEKAIGERRKTGTIDTSRVRAEIVMDNPGYAYRLDGNNVDIEEEMVRLYANQVRYDVLANSVISNYRRINAVFNARM